MQLKFKRLPNGEGLPLPAYQSAGAAGLDICAAQSEFLEPGERALVPTGFAVEVPIGWQVEVRPRSGLAAKHGLTVLNTPGTIDADYRGEIKVILVNLGDQPAGVSVGDRLAQLVVMPAPQFEVVEVEDLSSTDRGEGGFGSTGA